MGAWVALVAGAVAGVVLVGGLVYWFDRDLNLKTKIERRRTPDRVYRWVRYGMIPGYDPKYDRAPSGGQP